jgi:DNA primase
MNYRLISILESILGEGKKSGSEYLFHCPFCSHYKPKLSVNVDDKLGYWKCWICNSNGRKLYYLFRRLSVPRDVIKELADILSDDIKYYRESKTDDSQTILKLPLDFKPLWVPSDDYEYKNAIAYVKRRGITAADILRYGIGYCSDGIYSGRIIVPSYDALGQLNYFVGRAYYDGMQSYKNPPISKNVIIFDNQINWKEPIILVEGVFDAMAVKRNAVPLLGKYLQAKLRLKLVTEKVEEITILLDTDAKKEAIDLIEEVQSLNIDTKLVTLPEKDASEVGFKNVWSYINSSEETDFNSLIKMKLA